MSSQDGGSVRPSNRSAFLRGICCGNSIRYWILALSFFILCSLFANMMIYGLTAVYYDKLLFLPDNFQQTSKYSPLYEQSGKSSSNRENSAPVGGFTQIVSAVTLSAKPLSNVDDEFGLEGNGTKNELEGEEVLNNDHPVNENIRNKIVPQSTTSANSEASREGMKLDRNYHSNRRHRRKANKDVAFQKSNSKSSKFSNGQNPHMRNFNENSSDKFPSTVKFTNDEIDNNAVMYELKNDGNGLSDVKITNLDSKANAAKVNELNDVVNDNFNTQSSSKLSKNFKSKEEHNNYVSAQSVQNSKFSENQTPSDESISSEPISYVDRDIIKLLTQSLVFGAPGLGVLAAHVPSGILLRTIGAKWTISLALLFSGFLTACFPFVVAQFGYWMVIFIRFLLGVCFSPALSFIGATAANWAKVSEQLFFVTFCFAALQLSLIISWRGSLELISDLEWGSLSRVFGAHAAVSGILLIFWLALYEDTPQKHRFVNGVELNKIMTGRVAQQCQNNRLEGNVFSRLLKSASAWVIWLTSFGYFLSFSMLAHFLPIYVFRVLQQRVDSTIVFPFILLFVTHLLTYGVTHLLESSTLKVRIANTMAFVLSAVIFVALAVSPPHDQFQYFAQRSVWMLWICVAPLGLATGGFIESAVVYGRYFSQFIISNLQVPFGMAIFISPIGVFLFTVDNAILRWRLVFFGCAACLALTAAMFAVLGRGKAGSWARQTWNPATTGKMRSLEPISATGEDCGLVAMRPIDEFMANRPNTSHLLDGATTPTRTFATH